MGGLLEAPNSPPEPVMNREANRLIARRLVVFDSAAYLLQASAQALCLSGERSPSLESGWVSVRSRLVVLLER